MPRFGRTHDLLSARHPDTSPPAVGDPDDGQIATWSAALEAWFAGDPPDVDGAIEDHEGEGNPHPGYLTPAEHTTIGNGAPHHARYTDSEADGRVTAGINDHKAAANPHTVYVLKSLLTTRGDMIRRGASALERFAKGTAGKLLRMGADDPDWQWEEAGIEYVIDGGGATIATGLAGGLEVPFDCFVTGWTITATDGNTGAIVVDVWARSYANFPPTVAQTIAGSEKPTITATGNKGQDLTLTTWTQALSKGDHVFFNVDSVTTLERVTVSLRVQKYRAS